MNPKDLFLAALEKPPGEREQFLASLEPDLRRRVEELLAAHQASGLQTAAPPATTDYAGVQPGLVTAGRYTLEQKLGEGGLGEVWVAKQTEPVKRRVAVKLVKAGMDSKSVLQRFDQERQALALMDHPNIAKVLDAGMTTDQQPFFVMELVNGLPLTKYCDEAKLTPRQRLELFVPICQAIQHAHHKGIVHRDLKPSNILVSLIDGWPVPKVIDFGVAKATAGKLTDESLSTQFGAIVGTFEYMAPEQAGFSGQDVDTRADLYSLGVILYELLSGLRPFDSGRLKKAAIDEMLRILREEEPPRPSARLSSDASAPSLAALRQTEPRKLSALMRGELDWVVMKCLEKDRNRRYETANGLARDVQRYLADEPVEARPPSAGYRLTKFVRRNRGPVMAASIVFLALLAGIIGTTWGLAEANKARDAEAQQRKAALAARDAAFDALLAMTSSDALATLTKQAELTKEQKQFLEGAVKSFNPLVQAEIPSDGVSGRRRFAQALLQLGSCLTYLHRYESAAAVLRQACQQYQLLLEEIPNDAELQRHSLSAESQLSAVLKSMGRFVEAEQRYRELVPRLEARVAAVPEEWIYCAALISCRLELATLLFERDHYVEAERTYRLAIQECRQFLARHPQERALQSLLASLHENFGSLLMNMGKLDEAEQVLREGLELETKLAAESATPEKETGVVLAQDLLGAFYARARLAAEAEKVFRASIQTYQRLVDADPGAPWLRSALANCWGNLGLQLEAVAKPAEAEEAYQIALKLQEKLVADHPNVREHRMTLARSHCRLGLYLIRQQRWTQAEAALQEAVRLETALVTEFPEQPKYRLELALYRGNLGDLFWQQGRLAESATELRAALGHFEAAAKTAPLLPDQRVRLAGVQLSLASQLASAGRAAEAMALQRALQKDLAELVRQLPSRIDCRHILAVSHHNTGNLLRASKPAEAEAEYRRAVRLGEEIVELVGDLPIALSYRDYLASY